MKRIILTEKDIPDGSFTLEEWQGIIDAMQELDRETLTALNHWLANLKREREIIQGIMEDYNIDEAAAMRYYEELNQPN